MQINTSFTQLIQAMATFTTDAGAGSASPQPYALTSYNFIAAASALLQHGLGP